MAYPTLALHLLISAPGDVPLEDMAVIRKTISQWNLNLGRHVGLTVLPVSWTEHAVAEFGERPQEILNHQIVEGADLAVALFQDLPSTGRSSVISTTSSAERRRNSSSRSSPRKTRNRRGQTLLRASGRVPRCARA